MHLRFAQIEPTTRCNYTCGFCVGRHMPQQDMSLDTFRRFIDQVEGLEALELQGEGEPLLHPDFFAMVTLAREKFPDLEISMISNGSMFTRDNIDKLLDARIARIFVSVESVNAEDFQRIRGGKLERVRRGIRQLLARRNERGMSRPIIGLTVTALRSTAHELPDMLPMFYRDLQLDGGINVQPLQTMPQYTDIYDDAMTQELLDARSADAINKALQTSEPLQALLSERAQQADTGFYERLYGSVDLRLFCPWLVNGAYISTAGKIAPCCHIKDYDRYAVGDVNVDIDQSAAHRKQMQLMLHSGRIPQPCHGCELATGIVRNVHALRDRQKRTP